MPYDVVSELKKLDNNSHDLLYVDGNKEVKVWKASEHRFSGVQRLFLSIPLLGGCKFGLDNVKVALDQQLGDSIYPDKEVSEVLKSLKDRIAKHNPEDSRRNLIDSLREKFIHNGSSFSRIYNEEKSRWEADNKDGENAFPSYDKIDWEYLEFKSVTFIKDYLSDVAKLQNSENKDKKILQEKEENLSSKLKEFMGGCPLIKEFWGSRFDNIVSSRLINSAYDDVGRVFESIKSDLIQRFKDEFLHELFGSKLEAFKEKYGRDLLCQAELSALRVEYFQRINDNVNICGNLEGELEAAFQKKFLEKICDDKAEAFRKKNGSDSNNDLDLNVIKNDLDEFLPLVTRDIQMDVIDRKWDEKAKELVKLRNLNILECEFPDLKKYFPLLSSNILSIDNKDKFRRAVIKFEVKISNKEKSVKEELRGYQERYSTLNLQENDLPLEYFLLSSKKGTKSSSPFTIAVKKWVEVKVIDSNKKAWDELCDAYPELNLKVLNLPESIYKLSGANFISEVKKLILKDVLMPKYAQEYPEVQFKIDDLPPKFFDISNIKDFEAAIKGWVNDRSAKLMILYPLKQKIVSQLNEKNVQFEKADMEGILNIAVEEMARGVGLDPVKVLKGEVLLTATSQQKEKCISNAVAQVAKMLQRS